MVKRLRTGTLPVTAVVGVLVALLLLVLPLTASAKVEAQGHSDHGIASSDPSAAGMAGVRPVVASQLLAVDLGAEWVKAAVLRVETTPTGMKTGPSTVSAAGVHLVLNDQSQRKSAPCVAFRYFPSTDGTFTRERVLAASAAALEPRFPLQVVCSPSLLLGHDAGADQPRDLAAFPNNITTTVRRAGEGGAREALAVSIPTPRRNATEEVYSAEELVGMILGYAKRMAEKADADVNGLIESERLALPAEATPEGEAEEAGNVLRHAVLTVPTFATLAQRQAVVDAAALAGLRVVRLVHAATAAAVQLAQRRGEQLFADPSTSSTYVLIYDMGSRQTEAAVYEFTTSARRDNNVPPRVTGIALKALAVDHTLGGKAFDQCIATYWDRTFLGSRVFGDTTAASAAASPAQRKEQVSLLRAAQRARETLSVNREAVVTVDGVTAPVAAGASSSTPSSGPFATVLTRHTFDQVCAQLFDKAAQVHDEAVAALATSLSEDAKAAATPGGVTVDHVEVIGGATRMPKLLEVLGQHTSHGVGRHLNGDEAPVLGAVYLGAHSARLPLASAIDVSEWLTNDIDFALHPADAVAASPDEPAREAARTDRRADAILFPRRETTLPAVKSVRLHDPRYTAHDFQFEFLSPLPELVDSAEKEEEEEGNGGGASRGYRQAYAVQGVAAAVDRARRWQRITTFTTPRSEQRVDLIDSEVVVEAAVSESGIPSVRKAYLRVVFNKTTAEWDVPAAPTDAAERPSEGSETPVTTPDTEEAGDGEEVVALDNNEDDVDATETEDTISDAEAAPPHDAGPQRETQHVNTREVVRVFGLDVFPVETPLSRSHRARTLNMGKAELVEAKAVLAALQREDDARWRRSALSNDIETLVLHMKSSEAWEDAAARGDGWAKAVQETSFWLDDHGDSATIEELIAHKQQLVRLRAQSATP